MNQTLDDYALIIRALTSGRARWEQWEGRSDGELCFGGIRYSLSLDGNGVPMLHDLARAKLIEMEAKK